MPERVNAPPKWSGKSLHRRILKSVGGYSIARGVGFASMLLVLPAVAHVYGVAGLGVYAAIASLNAFLGALDAGAGAAVRTAIAEEHATGDTRRALSLVPGLRAQYRLWIVISLFVAVTAAMAIPWEMIFGVGMPVLSNWSLRASVAAFAAIYLLGVQQQLNLRVLEGLGRSGTASLVIVLGPATVLILSLFSCALAAPLLVTSTIPALSPIAVGVAARLVVARLCRQQTVDGSLPTGGHGLNFAVAAAMTGIAIGLALSYSLDYWLVVGMLGPAEAGAYAAAARPAQVMLVVAAAASPVLWTHFVRARAIERRSELSRPAIVRLVIVFGIVAVATSMTYVVGCTLLGSTLTAGRVAPPQGLIWAFGLWGILMIGHQPLAMMLTTAADLRFQFVTIAVMSTVNVGLSVELVPRVGSQGAVFASCLALGLVHIPLLTLRCRRYWRMPSPGLLGTSDQG